MSRFQTIRAEYNTSLSSSQWVISIYVLALGIGTPMSGFLADRFGIKRMYVGGLTTFVLGSLLCGLAPTLSSSIWLAGCGTRATRLWWRYRTAAGLGAAV